MLHVSATVELLAVFVMVIAAEAAMYWIQRWMDKG